MNGDPIEFRTVDGISWIRPFGKATFLNSSKAKEFSKDMIAAGIRMFHLDLTYCTTMDSTFVGTVAGLALRLREIGEGKVVVLNCPENIRKFTGELGLEDLLSFTRLNRPRETGGDALS